MLLEIAAAIHGLIEGPISAFLARRRLLADLPTINPVLLEGLLPYYHEAAATWSREFRESDAVHPAQRFSIRFRFLIDAGAVEEQKSFTPGIRIYRFEPWFFNYLTDHLEILESREGKTGSA